jgi:hypothetical protein
MTQLCLVPQSSKAGNRIVVASGNSPLCRYQRIMQNLETVENAAEEEVLLARASVLFSQLNAAERRRVNA